MSSRRNGPSWPTFTRNDVWVGAVRPGVDSTGFDQEGGGELLLVADDDPCEGARAIARGRLGSLIHEPSA